MRLQAYKGDLTAVQKTCAIVNPTSTSLHAIGAVSKAIQAAVGPACQWLPTGLQRLARGDAVISMLSRAPENRLACQYVIHASLPKLSGMSKQRLSAICTWAVHVEPLCPCSDPAHCHVSFPLTNA